MQTRALSLVTSLALGAAALAAKAPNGKEFPEHWGAPPKIQTRDIRALPGGYGRGSSTLAKWIQSKLDKDGAKARPGEAVAWRSLFGPATKDLKGWSVKSGFATYAIKDGAIVGTTAEGSGNSFLTTDKQFGDFELEFEVKVQSGLNSGVQIRSTLKKPDGAHGGRLNGPQVEIEASGEKGAESGYIYGEATGRGWLTPDERRKPHRHFKDDAWNQFRIVAEGARIRTWINGDAIEDLTDDAIFQTHPIGHIGLQVHGIKKGTGPYTVQWRNIRIKESDAKAAPVPGKQRPAAAPKKGANNLPIAHPVAGKPGHVLSPFALGREVDVTGFPQGTEVRCPYSGEIFACP